MAKKDPAAAAAPSTALAKSETTIIGAYGYDPLADVLGDEELDVTGTEDVGTRVRIPAYVLNTKFVPQDGDGAPISPNTFLNTVTEKPKKVLRLQLLTAERGHEWAETAADGKRTTYCRSFDRLMGNLRHEDGTETERPCKGCPDREWRKVDGKNTRRCGDTMRVVGMDLETGDACVIPLRKTAVKPFDEYYQREFFKKRPGVNATAPRRDMPLFAFETVVDAQMVKAAQFTWAQARFAKGEALSREMILGGAASLKDYRETKRHLVDDAVESAASHESAADPTGFDFGANAEGGGGGDRYVESTVDAGMG